MGDIEKKRGMRMLDRKKILTVNDIMQHLGISQNKAYKLVQYKGFPKITIGHRYFIPEDAYLKWIDENLKHTIIL
jgi:predicted DNA-binding transcriptional regulator AlpA